MILGAIPGIVLDFVILIPGIEGKSDLSEKLFRIASAGSDECLRFTVSNNADRRQVGGEDHNADKATEDQ